MQLLANTTSPFVRIARVAMIEKGLDIEPTLVDPWADDVRLRAANTAARVPTLVLDDGSALSECLLIVQWLEATRPAPAWPSVLGADPARMAGVLSRTGVAIGAIEASTITTGPYTHLTPPTKREVVTLVVAGSCKKKDT